MDRLLQQQEQYVDVQTPLSNALHEKYDAKVNAAGLERAVQRPRRSERRRIRRRRKRTAQVGGPDAHHAAGHARRQK